MGATRHDLHEMPVIALPCIISGGESGTDMSDHGRIREGFLRRFTAPEHGIPSRDAASDPAGSTRPEALHAASRRLARGRAQHPEATPPDDVIATGGKALRRSLARASAPSPHPVHAFATDARPVPARVAAGRKPGGITAIPALPEMPGIRRRMAAADAMHVQRQAAGWVTARGGGCIPALKGNQETPEGDVRLHMADPERAEDIRGSGEHAETGHGRSGIRQSAICHEAGRLRDLHHLPGLQAARPVTATREIRGERSTRARCFLMSRKPDPEPLLRGAGAHRRVENSLHRIPDVTMNGDSLRSGTGRGPERPALMRRPALDPAPVTAGRPNPCAAS